MTEADERTAKKKTEIKQQTGASERPEIMEQILDLLAWVRSEAPMIHIIPNTVVASFIADIVAAAGARPIMATSPMETAEIAAASAALVVNMGQPGDEKERAAALAIEAARAAGHPIVLDPVGAGASAYRSQLLQKLAGKSFQGIIKGNYSEIQAIQTGHITHEGVDSVKKADISLQGSSERVYAATGNIDMIFDDKRVIRMHHLSPRKYTVVGTGCATGGLIGAYAAAGQDPAAAATAGIALMSFAEEKVRDIGGYGRHKMGLLDAVSDVSSREVKDYLMQVLTEEYKE